MASKNIGGSPLPCCLAVGAWRRRQLLLYNASSGIEQLVFRPEDPNQGRKFCADESTLFDQDPSCTIAEARAGSVRIVAARANRRDAASSALTSQKTLASARLMGHTCMHTA